VPYVEFIYFTPIEMGRMPKNNRILHIIIVYIIR